MTSRKVKILMEITNFRFDEWKLVFANTSEYFKKQKSNL